MFEFSVAFKYLVPRKRHLTVTLIAMMSVGVISLIVWLLLVFLSVTQGIEANWLKKLTDLHAPVRITPTQEYFSSYYYKVDSLSNASGFSLKTLGEKQEAPLSDPYNPEEDPEIPSYWEKPQRDSHGLLLDPVKGLTTALISLQKKHPSLYFQDYEMSGALLKLHLLRNRTSSPSASGQESLHFLTQVSYLATPPAQEKILSSLLIPPSEQDINHLLFLANYRLEKTLEEGAPSVFASPELFAERIKNILPFLRIRTLKTAQPFWKLPGALLPENIPFSIKGTYDDIRKFWDLTLTSSSIKNTKDPNYGTLIKKADGLHVSIQDRRILLSQNTDLALEEPLIFTGHIEENSLESARCLPQVLVHVKGMLQGQVLKGTLPWKDLLIESFTPASLPSKDLRLPPWPYAGSNNTWELPISPQGEYGILLPKGFQDNGVFLGDKGFLSYQAATSGGQQEQRIPIFVAGFYDPGVISIGSKCLLVPREITRAINSSHSPFFFDKISLGGFQVWVDNPQDAALLQKEIKEVLSSKKLLPYWNVSSYHDYDFAKDLLQQFQSDKMLLSLVGLIILLVACCNIVSFLILLVSDKKKEIAILQAMGASMKSIALIFGTCGVIIGILGCALGSFAAIITLKNIDHLAYFLSSMQGHDAFNPAFYGNSLPNHLSSDALFFIFLATPILSLLSGLIPALKACKLSPSSILRSES